MFQKMTTFFRGKLISFRYEKYNNITSFILEDDKGVQIQLSGTGFIWFKKGDIVLANYNSGFYCNVNPIILISSTTPTIEQCIKFLTGKDIFIANQFCKYLSSKTGYDLKVIGNLICNFSDAFVKDKKLESYLLQNDSLDISDLSKVFNYCYKDINLRRLYTLGLTNYDIEKSMIYPSQIYDLISTSRIFSIIGLELEKARKIASVINLEVTTDMLIGHNLMLIMYNDLTAFKNTCCGIRRKIYPQLNQSRNILFNHSIIYDDDYSSFYLKPVYDMEKNFIDMLKYIDNMEDRTLKKDNIYVNQDLNNNQRLAIETSLTNNLCIITGAAGTGKTTVIKNMSEILHRNSFQTFLISFTGRAVCIIRKTTGSEATTFHSLYKKLTINIPLFKRNKGLHLIIDECSMVHMPLLYRLLILIKNTVGDLPTITFIGDPNQLPPVSWGNFFEEIIESKTIRKVSLNKNYRIKCADGTPNGIIINSESISRGIKIDGKNFIETDNFLLLEGNCNTVLGLTEHLVLQKNHSIDGIIIINPYVKDVNYFNKQIQAKINNNYDKRVDSVGNIWIVGDKLMLTKNNNHHKIYNGQEGILLKIDKEHNMLVVKFKDRQEDFYFRITNKKNEGKVDQDENDPEVSSEELFTHNLTLSYAITGHKSQGGSWSHVIISIPQTQGKLKTMLNKKWLYTVLSRAENRVTIVGCMRTLNLMRNTPYSRPRNNIARRLKENLTIKDEILQDPNTDLDEALKILQLEFKEENSNCNEDEEGDSSYDPFAEEFVY